MSSTFLQFRSQPTLYVMSSSKLNQLTYNSNHKDIVHPKQPDSNQPESTHSDHNNEHPSVDKIQFKSTNRSSHHQVSADNWRIRYYMNLNLVKQPQHISMQYRSSSLPHQSVSAHPSLPSDNPSYDQSRKSIERKQTKQHNLDVPIFIEPTKHKKKSKRIHIIRKTRSQNNTPPRQYTSLLRKHHKKCRLSRLRSRSDGMLSFQGKQKSISVESVEDDDDNDSVSTTDSVNNHHLDNAIHINTIKNLTPPGTGKVTNIMPYNTSSRTPPGIVRNMRSNPNRNRFESEPIKYYPPQSIAVRRSKPLSIHKHKSKARFDMDYSYQVSSPELVFDNVNTEYLVDDEANFPMD